MNEFSKQTKISQIFQRSSQVCDVMCCFFREVIQKNSTLARKVFIKRWDLSFMKREEKVRNLVKLLREIIFYGWLVNFPRVFEIAWVSLSTYIRVDRWPIIQKFYNILQLFLEKTK